MGFDMVVALSGTTPEGQTLFGYNGSRPAGEGQALRRQTARAYTHGETLSFGPLMLPQVRQTHAVLGWQSAGSWGYRQGVNEHRVVAGCGPLRTRLASATPGLSGPDLVRLALERTTNARQARDLILDLVNRHGLGWLAGEEPDSSFLVADVREAFVLETAGNHWAEQEVHAVRAVGEVCNLHQDWDRISRGLAELAVDRGWWPEDGSKLDFADVVAPHRHEGAAAMRRWGRATLLLEQQSGRLDQAFFRRLLSDHFENPVSRPADVFASPLTEQSICRHADAGATTASLIVEWRPAPEHAPVMWCAFGPPCTSLYFPILLGGELPPALQEQDGEKGCRVWQSMARLLVQCRQDPRQWQTVREEFAHLQSRFDEDCSDLLTDAARLHRVDSRREWERLTESFMQHNVECFDEVCERLCPTGAPAGPKRPVAAAEGRQEDEEMSVSAF